MQALTISKSLFYLAKKTKGTEQFLAKSLLFIGARAGIELAQLQESHGP
jgi:hypothetical protein